MRRRIQVSEHEHEYVEVADEAQGCRHLGENLDVQLACQCAHRGTVDAYRCNHPAHAAAPFCTLAARAKLPGVPCCLGCLHREPLPQETAAD